MTEDRSPGTGPLDALAAAVGDRLGAGIRLDAGDGPALVWTDGPTVGQVTEAARACDPGAAGRLAFRRELSERSVALGAIRLARAIGSLGCGLPAPVCPATVAELWRDTPLPAPPTAREETLVQALLYEVHDDHRSNHVTPEQICDGLMVRGTAALARRMGLDDADGA
ncbi:hypothetical protein GCM10017562_58850 [Streptomyces roseofulvus]|uniref:Uncharacterized protein n=2 Tax=Streptomyces TaxID=1883 RepID=A0ABU4K4X9_9ACTN|nr:hypothetical protein [Streptomyces roseolus]MDX2292782.1 hypothetical protein [Streptomyces roseolus]